MMCTSALPRLAQDLRVFFGRDEEDSRANSLAVPSSSWSRASAWSQVASSFCISFEGVCANYGHLGPRRMWKGGWDLQLHLPFPDEVYEFHEFRGGSFWSKPPTLGPS